MTEMPPRSKKLPEVSLASALVARMSQEQEVRGWSDGYLASRVADYHPMTASGVWKIKNAGRQISLDESYAISRAFGYHDVTELLGDEELSLAAFMRAAQSVLYALDSLHDYLEITEDWRDTCRDRFSTDVPKDWVTMWTTRVDEEVTELRGKAIEVLDSLDALVKEVTQA